MKKVLLLNLIILTFGSFSYGQTTATDFTATSCTGTDYNLYDELDAGKTVVITWVMPCFSCIGPAVAAFDAVQTYPAGDNVVFYLVDDYANTSCNTMNSWATDNSMSHAIIFSDNAIDMADYGTAGMPKVVVISCSREILYNSNTGASGLTTAIDQAIIHCETANFIENPFQSLDLNVWPNPAQNTAFINYNLSVNTEININIYNLLGENVKTVINNEQQIGQQNIPINTDDLPNGVYFIKLDSAEDSRTIKLTISH